MANYIDIFGQDESLEWEVLDSWGWTALHRAAAYGTAAEVHTLIKHGASSDTLAMPLCWAGIHHAVFNGNIDTFLALVGEKYTADIQRPDVRGWSLLHIAASAGHDDIVRHLLGLGADYLARSLPYGSHMPDELLGRRITPAEAALAQSRDRYEQYVKALRSFGLGEKQMEEALKTDDAAGDEDEIFSDAVEAFHLPFTI